MNPRFVLVLMLLALAACKRSPILMPYPNGDYTVLDRQVWPGGTIRIASEDFRTWGEGASLTFANSSIPLTRLDATTMSGVMPSGHATTGVPTLRYDNYSFQLATLTRAGYLDDRSLSSSANIIGDAYVTALAGEPHVIGGVDDGRLAIINMRTGAVDAPPIFDVNELRGPGMTYLPGNWILRSTGSLESWLIGSTPIKLADHAEFLPDDTRQVARLSAANWLLTTNDRWELHSESGSSARYATLLSTKAISEPEGIYVSPRGDRATLRVGKVETGVPVFDAQLGSVAYTTAFTSVQGVDFSADGAQLALVGNQPGAAGSYAVLEVLNATSGSVMSRKAIDGDLFAVRFDPEANRLLVGVTRENLRDKGPSILVFQLPNLVEVAQLDVLGSGHPCSEARTCQGAVIGVHHDEVIVFHSHTGPAHLWRFKLLTQ
jgi:hypothetical protein